MQQLGCDPSVWKQMFEKIWEHIYEEEVTEDFNVDTLQWEVIKVKDAGYFNEPEPRDAVGGGQSGSRND